MADTHQYERMLTSRYFEEKLRSLFQEGALKGTTHLSIGQEGCHVGLVSGLDDQDWIVPTHRCHGYNIARSSSLVAMFGEMLGSREGICSGLGGSMHMSDVATYDFGSSAIVGSGVPIAAGLAYAERAHANGNIAVAIFGDGATSRGSVHESMNIAGVWHLPLLFFCENNLYGMSAASSRMIATSSIASRAKGYNIPAFTVDGNDVRAVREAVRKARSLILTAHTPVFIEAYTYRMCGHSKSDARVYRSREEEAAWREKDPLIREYHALKADGVEPDELDLIAQKSREEVENAYQEARASKGFVLSLDELSSLVLLPESKEVKVGNSHRGTYRRAIREAIDAILRRDLNARLWGEDVGLYGGCFGVTHGLSARYPDQIQETPVSEECFTGMAVGASALGIHPIVEVMYGDFSTLASDALINHAAKLRFMSAGQLSCPFVFRTPMGSGTGHGAQHTQNLESLFLSVPGLEIVAPGDAWSAKALLLSSAASPNPVLYFEHKALYGEEGDIPSDDVLWPIGKGRVLREGKDLLIVSYSHATSTVSKALSGRTDSICHIDLMSIKPWDRDLVKAELLVCRRLLFVQDSPESGSIGDSVVSSLLADEEVFRSLLVPPRVLSGKDIPIPFSPVLEAQMVPTAGDVQEAVSALLQIS